jgi:hypothetical protein
MSLEKFKRLVRQTCEAVGLADVDAVLQRRTVDIEGFEVMLHHYDNDPEAAYVMFNFGIVTAGRTLRVHRLLLEANLTVYAQDQAQMGMLSDTGAILLLVRTTMGDDIDGPWMAETFRHYAEHGRYWRDSIITATDEMFDGLCTGQYMWLRA